MSNQASLSVPLKRYESLSLFIPGALVALGLAYLAYAIGDHPNTPLFSTFHTILHRWIEELGGGPVGAQLGNDSTAYQAITEVRAVQSQGQTHQEGFAQLWQFLFLIASFVFAALVFGNLTEELSKFLIETLSFNRVIGYPYQSLLKLNWFRYRTSITRHILVDKKAAGERIGDSKTRHVHITRVARLSVFIRLLRRGLLDEIFIASEGDPIGAFTYASSAQRKLLKSHGPKLVTHLIFFKAALLFGLGFVLSAPFAIAFTGAAVEVQHTKLWWLVFAIAALSPFLRTSWLPMGAALLALITLEYVAHPSLDFIGVATSTTFLTVVWSGVAYFGVMACTSLGTFGSRRPYVKQLRFLRPPLRRKYVNFFSYIKAVVRFIFRPLGEDIVKAAWRHEQLTYFSYALAGIDLEFPQNTIDDVKMAFAELLSRRVTPNVNGTIKSVRSARVHDSARHSDPILYDFGSNEARMNRNSEPYWAAYWFIQRYEPAVTDKINKYVNITGFHRNMIGAMIINVFLFGITSCVLPPHFWFLTFMISAFSVSILLLWSRFVYFYIFTTKCLLRQMPVQTLIKRPRNSESRFESDAADFGLET
jgi:hypothetical protein